MGKLFKGVAKFTIAAAAIGGLAYVFKDQIKESKPYKEYEVDEKIKKVKTTLKEKMPAIFDNEADFVEEDDLSLDLDLAAEDVERDYVSITPEAVVEDVKDAVEEAKDAAADKIEEVKEAVKDAAEDIPTIEA
ncbi:MAG: hypothetical protein IJZ96_05970 [Lachnospiraceae bacterium]|nr:hypothetical protein [Lachnospiraceae bacterium]MBQ8166562.1 hypothetical protein [Lachnospiraceae bacterium]